MTKNVFLKKVVGRLFRAIAISFWVMVISFMLIRITPGDPAATRLGAGAEAEAIEALRKQLKLDVSPIEQFLSYASGLFRGDLGVSLVTGVEVLEVIRNTLPLTLTYIFLSVFFAFLISIPISTLVGWSNKASVVYLFRGITSVIIATPNFFIAMIGILLFSVRREWAPVFGYVNDFPENLKWQFQQKEKIV